MTALHVFRRDGVFYWRRRLPAALATILEASHLCRSLRTVERKVANRRAVLISAAVDELEEDVSVMANTLQQPSKADLHRILFEIFNWYLDVGELARAKHQDGSNPWHEAKSQRDLILKQRYAIEAKWTKPEDYAKESIQDLNQNERHKAAIEVRRYFQRYHFSHFEDEKKRAVFERMVLAVVATAQRFNADRDNGIYDPAIFPFAQNAKQMQPHSPLDAWERRRLSVVFKDFVAYKAPEWDDGTVRKANRACQLFVALMGDIPYLLIQKNDAARFRDILNALPARYAQLAIYRGLSLQEVRTRAADIRMQLAKGETKIKIGRMILTRQDAEAATTGMHPTTTTNHILWLHGFYEWARRDGLHDAANPFDGIGYSKERAERATPEDKKRKPWPAEWQTKLFRSPIWTGFESLKNRNRAGSVIVEDEAFWAPLIAIFSGMRMEEILQLWVKDIQTIDGIACFTVSSSDAEGKRSKTKQAHRTIPVHSELIKIGFMQYVDAAKRAKCRLLFPGAARDKKTRKLEKYFSKTFSTRIRSLSVPAAYNFHTLRNTFNTAIEAKGLTGNNMARYLMGHKMNAMAERYVDPKQIKALKEIVERVEPEIDFSFMHHGKQSRRYDFKEHPSRKGDKELA